MIQKIESVLLRNGTDIQQIDPSLDKAREARGGTISNAVLWNHDHARPQPVKALTVGEPLRLTFDSLTSHDITYVGIIQTARASGMEAFPMPYVMTNCHNSLCAVGGTINEDDHVFALSAARKYGGTYVPPHLAVIHSYNREMMTGCGRMILGSDSHTRYGALGTMAVGEGGGELAKQLLKRTYDFAAPEVVGVMLTGAPSHGVGPHDVALAIIREVYGDGFVKNRVMEFFGPGLASLPVEYRNAVDVMTTETTCWSSIWATDDQVRAYYRLHGREKDFRPLAPASEAYYERMLIVNLSEVKPMIALPFHPSNAYTIAEFKANMDDILASQPKLASLRQKIGAKGLQADQGVIAGCSGGTFDNLCAAADILDGGSVGNGPFSMSAYPGSMPAYLALLRCGATEQLLSAGVLMRECFCGPCFGAGDTPANGALSLRHTTRNFPNREGSKPGEGQSAFVALMDARSIAATGRMGGILTGADEVDWIEKPREYTFDDSVYKKRVYTAATPDPAAPLVMGPNIKDWPPMPALKDSLLLKVVSHIDDPVTTTDELIPSGETSSFRSNPLRLAEFTLSRRDPGYVARAKAFPQPGEAEAALRLLPDPPQPDEVSLGSAIFANKPGDGSAREQAASCQRVLGGAGNLAREYATKRYRSNLINWGIIPFLTEEDIPQDAYVYVPGVRNAILEGKESIPATVIVQGCARDISLRIGALTRDEREILVRGCLINYYRDTSM